LLVKQIAKLPGQRSNGWLIVCGDVDDKSGNAPALVVALGIHDSEAVEGRRDSFKHSLPVTFGEILAVAATYIERIGRDTLVLLCHRY